METTKEKLEQKRARLAAYLERERAMLSGEAVQSYSIDSRSVQRYNTNLAEIRRAIIALELEIAELEARLSGEGPRKIVGVVPRDW